MTTVLVVGLPRSGSSWVGRVLGSTPGASYLEEPDNHGHVPFALRAKLGIPGRFYPHLPPSAEAPVYERLWRRALEPGDGWGRLDGLRRASSERLLARASASQRAAAVAHPRSAAPGLRLAARLAVPERRPAGSGSLVVKSVYAQLALDWLTERFPLAVLVVLRQPLNVLASWKEMGWLGPGGRMLAELDPRSAAELERALGVPPVGEAAPIEEAAHLAGLLSSALLDGARRHPDRVAVAHEELCVRPHELFPRLAERLGLAWDDDSDRLLDDLNRDGRGYETTRVGRTLPEAWRTRLGADEVAAARGVLARFPHDWTVPA